MRCPVPYALVALFGWGVIDWAVGSARRLFAWRPRGRPPVPAADALTGGLAGGEV